MQTLGGSKLGEINKKIQEEYINYKYISPISGNQHEVRVRVTIQGDPSSPASFLTMHDMGMTCELYSSNIIWNSIYHYVTEFT